MGVDVNIKEESRNYEFVCDLDSSSVAEGLRTLADILENSEMLPTNLSFDRKVSQNTVTMKIKLNREFKD